MKLINYFKSQNLFSFIFLIGITFYSIIAAISFYQSVLSATYRVTDENIFAGNTPKIVVRLVVPNGASDRAGMIVGDTIVAINGQTFKNATEADRILRQAKPGEIMDYNIIRGNKHIVLKVQAAMQKVLLAHIIGVIVGLIFIGIGLYFAYVRHYIKTARLLSVCLILLAPFAATSIIGNAQPSFFFNIQLISSLFIGLPLVFHLIFHIPYYQEKKWERSKRVMLVYYSLNIICLIFSIIDLHIQGRILLNPFNVVYPNIASAISNYTFGVITLYTISLAFYHTFKRTSQKVKSLKYIRFAWLLAIAGLIGGRIAISQFIASGALLFLLTALIPLSYFYVISKENVFGLSYVIKRNYKYLAVFSSLVSLAVVLFLFLVKVISNIELNDLYIRINPASIEFNSDQLDGFSQHPFYVFMGIILLIVYVFILSKVKSIIDKRFYKTKHNYKEVLSQLSNILANSIQSESELYSKLTEFLATSLKIKGCALFLNVEKQYTLKSYTGFGISFTYELNELSLNPDHVTSLKEVVEAVQEKNKSEIEYYVPIHLNDKKMGFLLLGEKESEDVFQEDDIELIQLISNQITIILEHLKLTQENIKNEFIKRDIELAKSIQLGLLPQHDPALNELDIHGYYQPAKGVGGDYYDYLQNKHNNSISVVVGDVSGKGVSASLYMSRFQGIMRSLYYNQTKNPKDILENLNTSIYRDIDKGAFVTCIYTEFEMKTKTFKCARAGHSPMLHFRSSENKFLEIKSNGIGLGLTDSNLFNDNLEQYSNNYIKDDIFILYSDGISEAMNTNREEYGDDKLKTVVKENAHLSATDLSEQIRLSISEFTNGAEPNDDITFVTIKVKH